MTIEIKKYSPTTYRVVADTSIFGQIKRVDQKWHAEYRETETGTLIKFAGIWVTRQDAIDEVSPAVERGMF